MNIKCLEISKVSKYDKIKNSTRSLISKLIDESKFGNYSTTFWRLGSDTLTNEQIWGHHSRLCYRNRSRKNDTHISMDGCRLKSNGDHHENTKGFILFSKQSEKNFKNYKKKRILENEGSSLTFM